MFFLLPHAPPEDRSLHFLEFRLFFLFLYFCVSCYFVCVLFLFFFFVFFFFWALSAASSIFSFTNVTCPGLLSWTSHQHLSLFFSPDTFVFFPLDSLLGYSYPTSTWEFIVLSPLWYIVILVYTSLIPSPWRPICCYSFSILRIFPFHFFAKPPPMPLTLRFSDHYLLPPQISSKNFLDSRNVCLSISPFLKPPPLFFFSRYVHSSPYERHSLPPP